METPKKILIVRLSAIGDVVHALPCLHALRRAFPDARIGWMVEELSATLLRGHPEIDELFVVPKKRWRAHPIRSILNGEQPALARRLRRGGWDAAIDLQGLTKSGVPLLLCGARQRIGFGDADGRELNKLFTNCRVTPPAEATHVIQRNLALLEPLGVRVEPEQVAWRFPDFSEEEAELAPFFDRLGGSAPIALYPGAGWETKRWPPESFAALARLLADPALSPRASRHPLTLVWGPGEESLCARILDAARLDKDILDLAPRTNLRQLAVLLRRSAAVVGGDTGPVHLAAALDTPVVGIYGGSDPARNGPWGGRVRVLLAQDAPCVLCWRTRCDRTPPIGCLSAISPEAAAEATEQILAENAR